MKLLIILLILHSFNSIAQVAVSIKQGDKSPISGVVITEEKVKELYKAEQSVIVLSDLRISDKELSEHYRYLAKDAQEKLNKAKLEAYWGTTAGFLVGVGISLFTFKVIQEGTR